jgi:hypothetical protein
LGGGLQQINQCRHCVPFIFHFMDFTRASSAYP